MAAGSTMVGMDGAVRMKNGGARRAMPKGGKQMRIGGKKVFAKEARSGYAMARATGLSFKTAEGANKVAQYSARLRALDAGTIQGKPGEKSFLRGVMKAVKRASGGG